MQESQNRALLHYETHVLSPQAEWVVFIHGAGGSLATWSHQVEAFRPYFNLLLLDLRDHGNSKDLEPAFDRYDFDIVTGDIIRVIDHAGIKKAHFLSLSLGSVILQKLDEERPGLIDKMVMAGGIFRATPAIHLFVHTAKLLSYLLPYRVMYDLFSWIVLPRKNHQQARRLFRQQSQKLTPREYRKWIGLYKDLFRLLRRFYGRELRKLSLVIMGEQDHVFNGAARRFVARHQKARIALIEKCGHVVNIEQHERFNQTVLAFLRGDSWIR